MLDRHRPASSIDQRGRQRRAAAERQRRCRARRRDGRAVVTVDIGADLVAWLVEKNWLREVDAGDDKAITRAVQTMLHEILVTP